MKSGGPQTSWFAGLPGGSPSQPPAGEDWEATRAAIATQVMVDGPEDPARREVGRAIGHDEHELFVSCAPAEALLQQFALLKPEFIALHDLGCAISRRLLGGVAAASQRRVQKLVVRRQGQGTPLATLQFIEWATPGHTPVRLYTTEIDADTASRHALAMALLSHGRLGVVFVGELPPHALATALQPLRDALRAGPWPNRHLLMLPLTAGSAIASQAAQLGGGVGVRTTPPVTRPAEAWAYLSATWNRLREQAGAAAQHLPVLAGVAPPAAAATVAAPAAPAAAQPAVAAQSAMVARAMPMAAQPAVAARAMPAASPGPSAVPPPAASPFPSASQRTAGAVPAVPAVPTVPTAPALPTEPAIPTLPTVTAELPAAPAAATRARSDAATPFPTLDVPPAPQDALAGYVERAMHIAGMLGCCVFDTVTHRVLARAGAAVDADALRRQAEVLLDDAARCGDALGLRVGTPELALTLDAHHVLLRAVPAQPQRMLAALLDKASANLVLARLQLQRLELEPGA